MSTLNSVIGYGTYASIPSYGIPGRLYFATDTGSNGGWWRDNGMAWQQCNPPGSSGGGGVPWLEITNPGSGGSPPSFAWRNQGSATETVGADSRFLTAPAVSGNNVRGREIACPGTPYSITIGFVPVNAADYHTCGLYVTDGTKLVAIVATTPDNSYVNVAEYTNVTTFNTPLVPLSKLFPITPLFFKVKDDGTNLTWYYSPDGSNFIQAYQASRTAYLSSPSNVGYMCESNNGSTPNGILLVSWAQGTS